MHPKLISSCMLSSIIAVIVVDVSWFAAYRYQWTTYSEDSFKRCQLIIGILSARGNLEQRDAIRDTWFPHPSSTSYCIRAHFVIGHDTCHIPPEDRLNEFDCKPWEINVNEVGDSKTIHFLSKAAPSASPHPVTMGLRFQVRAEYVQHPIVFNKLGILNSIAQSGRLVTAILEMTSSQEEVARITLSPQKIGTSVSGYTYFPVESLVLEKGFEGSVFLSTYDYVPGMEEYQYVNYSNGGGLLTFQQTMVNVLTERAFDNNAISAVSLGFTVYNLSALKLHVAQQSTRQANWDATLREETTSLHDEMHNHHDLVVVNATDTYRNLPLKLLLFVEWAVGRYDFDYLLKADDDCILNVNEITRFLESTTNTNKLWWGSFRYNWVVQRFGKWREANFGSAVYPPFACGVAYVISADIVHWIAKNCKELHQYQGEDISVGIWLSAVAPTYLHDTRWQCDEGCQKDALSRGQLGPDKIRHSWATFSQCGQYCSCDTE